MAGVNTVISPISPSLPPRFTSSMWLPNSIAVPTKPTIVAGVVTNATFIRCPDKTSNSFGLGRGNQVFVRVSKEPNLGGQDPLKENVVRLFNPRRQS
jgi:hypothetical protein